MAKTILYFHGFASSSDSEKAEILKKYISSFAKKTKLIIPDLNNNFQKAIKEIKQLIQSNEKPIAFMGSSLGGYYAAYFSSLYKSKAILINPAIPPLKGFDIYLGENENYSTGEKFNLTKEDIKFIRSISYKKYNNSKKTLILVESEDEVLNYIETSSYFQGCYIDITFGGNHSYTSLKEKLEKIRFFLDIK
tara:strand:- start:1262 stop:1837 length:576 start_codon:yes stop_codon:yes gene_type:complete